MDLWKEAILRQFPTIPVYNYLEDHPKEKIIMAIVWKHPHGSLTKYPNLRCIASFGAGVDFIFNDPTLIGKLPVTRVIDPVLASDMSEYVLSAVLGHLKNFNGYQQDQYRGDWKPKGYERIQDHTIGILGAGTLGMTVALDLKRIGFEVIGWVNSKKQDQKIRLYVGEPQKSDFLKKSTVLVCLLPLTKTTKGILNKENLSQLPTGAFLINVARGGHLVEDDLIALLNEGHLSGACLDVFNEEPLPKTHPFWKHAKVQITPHVASVSDPNSVVPQLVENYSRLQEGKPLLNKVDLTKGY
ncbi:MAG: glyoxylate/hydroxypyruvate reductase A [Eudoraea sp.]|nr:glyoxylate/hydroxypyruvate reductase A [Eudoraea sp.]